MSQTIEIELLQQIAAFGYFGYVRKKGVWYYKPYTQYLRYFDAAPTRSYQHVDLNLLALSIREILTRPEIKTQSAAAA